MKICLKHKYKISESGKEYCVKCGKDRDLPFFPFGYTVLKLNLSCWFWKLRGLQTCPHHGFHAQSLINGYCKKCGRSEWTKKEIKESERRCKELIY